jgi:hypothetical protein
MSILNIVTIYLVSQYRHSLINLANSTPVPRDIVFPPPPLSTEHDQTVNLPIEQSSLPRGSNALEQSTSPLHFARGVSETSRNGGAACTGERGGEKEMNWLEM